MTRLVRLSLGTLPLLLADSAWGQDQDPSLVVPVRDWRAHYALYLGQSELDSDFWDPADRPIAFGMEYGLIHRSGLGLELGMFFGYDQEESGTVDIGGTLFETDLSTELVELSAGARLELPLGEHWLAYGGGGLAWVDAAAETFVEEDLVIADDSDSDFGYYYHAGLSYRVTRDFAVGLDVRVLTDTELEIDSFDTDADYTQFALVLSGRR